MSAPILNHIRHISDSSTSDLHHYDHSRSPSQASPLTDYSIDAAGDEFVSHHEDVVKDGLLKATEDSRASGWTLESYLSSIPSEEDLPEPPPPDLIEHAYPWWSYDILPATSRDFSELFPSSRKYNIRHDDTTFDGNMNLRLDTPVVSYGGKGKKITLFHLRMYDLRSRHFSLRRYCRESGREICHSVRKNQKPILGHRIGLQRSLTSAFASFRSLTDHKSHEGPAPSGLKRYDSGYDSVHGYEEKSEGSERPSSSYSSNACVSSGDVINLEFSNYAHISLHRRGIKLKKRYDFDYWGNQYSWTKSINKLGTLRQVSYHLVRRKDERKVAYICPEPLSASEAQEETDQGGWIPPCSMWINDPSIIYNESSDVADVVVATGMIALVDDSIRRRFLPRETKQLIVSLPEKANEAVEGKPVDHERHPTAR
ncbi:MAG: hypothetical protein M1831_004862 [Alyxoria varia]|nr:MAG: hypothetical protein M1831_004862 [Alyxoria varia]